MLRAACFVGTRSSAAVSWLWIWLVAKLNLAAANPNDDEPSHWKDCLQAHGKLEEGFQAR